jgi:hypothetical protein
MIRFVVGKFLVVCTRESRASASNPRDDLRDMLTFQGTYDSKHDRIADDRVHDLRVVQENEQLHDIAQAMQFLQSPLLFRLLYQRHQFSNVIFRQQELGQRIPALWRIVCRTHYLVDFPQIVQVRRREYYRVREAIHGIIGEAVLCAWNIAD